MTFLELVTRYTHKHIATEDESLCWGCGGPRPCVHETERFDWEDPYHITPFGGEGWAVRFRVQDGQVFLDVDWGYTWPITEHTRIFETTPMYDPPKEWT